MHPLYAITLFKHQPHPIKGIVTLSDLCVHLLPIAVHVEIIHHIHALQLTLRYRKAKRSKIVRIELEKRIVGVNGYIFNCLEVCGGLWRNRKAKHSSNGTEWSRIALHGKSGSQE